MLNILSILLLECDGKALVADRVVIVGFSVEDLLFDDIQFLVVFTETPD